MTPSNRKTILELVQISDIGPLFSCLGIGYGLTSHRHLLDLLNSLETRHPIQVFIATIFLAFGWHVTLRSNDFYRSRRVEGYLKETRDVCSASVICALFSFLWLWLIASPPTRSFAGLGFVSILFCGLTVTALMLARLTGRVTMHALRSRGHNLRHILIVGTNGRANVSAQDFALHPEWGYHMQGFVMSSGGTNRLPIRPRSLCSVDSTRCR